MHQEHHKSHRSAWLRAAVLGANDGIVSTASLIIGVAAAGTGQSEIVLVAIAGLVAGALSMAAGEYVSVSSQADIEAADLDLERHSLRDDPQAELDELSEIYIERGLAPDLATQVAEQLMAHDALAAHARDELGFSDFSRARPWLAAGSSALAFATGAALPVVVAYWTPLPNLIVATALLSLLFLALLGAWAAFAGGAKIWPAAVRVCAWGAAAMVLTALVGKAFGVVV